MNVADLLTLAENKDVTDGELRELAERLVIANTAVDRLREIVVQLEMELAARVERDVTPVAGVGIVYRGYTKRSEWRDENSSADLRHDLGEAVASHVALDNATGEVDSIKRNIARATVDAMFELIPAFSSVKAPAKKYGLKISNYRTFRDVAVVTITTEGEP